MKRTPLDLALWAALPMAHTSKIEGRIAMILDSTRRRGLPRRALVFGAAVTAAALVPLAMLRPDAKAQTAPAVTDAVQLIGVVDAVTPNGNEWDADGKALPAPVFSNHWGPSTKITTRPGQKALFFVFHLSNSFQQAPVLYDISGTTYDGLSITRMGSSAHQKMALTTETMQSIQIQVFGNKDVYGAAFPAALAQTNIQAGIASDAGAETVDCPKTTGKVRVPRPSGEVIFTLLPHPQGEAAFMVSDHFHRPSPLKADNPLQVALHDGENYERSIYALDKSGKVLAKLPVTWYTGPDATTPDYRSIKTQQTGHLSSALLRRTASFRLVARPYQWTEFKNVALQPVQAERAAAPAPAPDVTPWNSTDNYEDWKVARTYRLSERIWPSVSGTRPEPPVDGRLASGPGRVANFVIKPWKPGKSNILTVQYDYTPKITDKVHPDVIDLLTKDGTVASISTQMSHE